MANKTVYPFGQGGSLPSGYPIVNDLVTGGADKALAAEQGKILNERLNEINGSESVALSSLTKYSYVISSSGTWSQQTGTLKGKCVLVALDGVKMVKVTMDGGGGVIAFLQSATMTNNASVDFSTEYTARITLSNGNTYYYDVPNDANYLYIAAANTDGTSVLSRYAVVLTLTESTLLRKDDVEDSLSSSSTDKPLSAAKGAELKKELGGSAFTIDELYLDYSTGAVSSVATTGAHTSYIDVSGVKRIRYSRVSVASTTTMAGMAFYDENKNYISGQRFILGSTFGLVDTVLSVPSSAVYARFSLFESQLPDFYIILDNSLKFGLCDMVRRVGGALSGKKVSIVGDSISCFGTEAQVRAGNYITPYWKVKDIDVGVQIQSYVTWLDVYTSVDSTTPTNKSIGGVTLTSAMIGTLQTFTPVEGDIGKCIGVPRWASAYTDKPWWQVFLEETGAEFCANASWSGSRVVPYPVGASRHDAFVMSELYSDYTLGRLKGRDDEGNAILPDIILIYRGTNDFTAVDSGVAEGLETPDMKSFTTITDDHNFTQGYIHAINRMRTLYPKAVIFLCTLTVMKKVNYSHYPSNNGTYTQPDYNNKIREIADLMGCGVIEFDKDGINWNNCYPTYISDSATEPLHPNTAGHKVMGMKAVSDVKCFL